MQYYDDDYAISDVRNRTQDTNCEIEKIKAEIESLKKEVAYLKGSACKDNDSWSDEVMLFIKSFKPRINCSRCRNSTDTNKLNYVWCKVHKTSKGVFDNASDCEEYCEKR